VYGRLTAAETLSCVAADGVLVLLPVQATKVRGIRKRTTAFFMFSIFRCKKKERMVFQGRGWPLIYLDDTGYTKKNSYPETAFPGNYFLLFGVIFPIQ
jgi:hypothetical protein